METVEPLFLWIALPARPGTRHALQQWLESVGLLSETTEGPPREPGDPALVALLLGAPESWSDPSPALAHLRRGGVAVLDADALASPLVAEATGIADLLAPAGAPKGPAGVPWKVSPLEGTGGRNVASRPLPGHPEAPRALLMETQRAPLLALSFSAARAVSWLLGAVDEETEQGIPPLDSTPYRPAPSFLTHPVLDIYGEVLWEGLARLACLRGRLLARLSPLPTGARLLVCLTHDVDGLRRSVRHLARTSRAALARREVAAGVAAAGLAACAGAARLLARAGLQRNRPHSLVPPPLARWARRAGVDPDWLPDLAGLLAAESAVAAPSALFFLDNRSWADSDYSFNDDVFRQALSIVRAKGCELGLHGTLASAEDEALLKEEARLLRTAVASPVSAVRQHHLRTSPNTRRSQVQAGFVVDSSVGYNFDTAFKAGTSRPFQLFDPKAGAPLDLWEVPVAAMDTALARGPVDPEERVLGLAQELRALGGVLTLNWHPNFAPRSGDNSRTYERIVRALAAQEGTEFWALSSLVAWWRGRGSVRLSSATYEQGRLHIDLDAAQPMERLSIDVAGLPVPSGPAGQGWRRVALPALQSGRGTLTVDLEAASGLGEDLS